MALTQNELLDHLLVQLGEVLNDVPEASYKTKINALQILINDYESDNGE